MFARPARCELRAMTQVLSERALKITERQREEGLERLAS